jgi:[acyl-carrier-protein] S-malonyltransferase
VEGVIFAKPDIPVVANVTGRPLPDVPAIREELVKQIISPVEWVASIAFMFEQGVTTFVEVGPKDTLTKMTRRIAEQARAISVGDVAGVDAWREGSTGQTTAGGA